VRSDPGLERVVRSWLQEEGHEDADRVLFTVLNQVDTTPQRRAGWLARRFPILNSTNLRYGIGAAAVILIALLGFNLLPPGDTGGPAVSPSPSPTPPALPDGTLEAGTYVLHPFVPPHDVISITATVPEGWEGFDGIGLLPVTGAAGPGGMGIGFNMVSGVYSDPCRGDAPARPAGSSVDDLVRAFRSQIAYESTDPVDVEVDGYSGRQVSLLMPSDVDFSSCDNGGFFVWEGSIYAQGPGNRWDLTILDVEGSRVVILAQTNPETSAEDRAELQGILDSIQIDAPPR